MPLNKLENFIKNAEGRILYVNPNDLDSTDGIENQGNSLTKPFKTIQRALLESARFSYLRGDDNDLVEKTTILVFPGEHLIDNRPGFAIKDVANNAIAVAPNGAESAAQNELTLTLNSNFDLTQENNILYKFNSISGGIIIPRGTSIVGLDLRKTKIRPKYVPNPTDDNVRSSAIFRITGACYFWQFTFFDGDESGLVYTDPIDFSVNNRSKPTFSHHKLTCFEYADGVNIPGGYSLTDLDMYYSKVSNAFNRASGREIDQKYPASPLSFAKQRPEWEIVGAFASDPITISSIISGDGSTPSNVVTVETQSAHGLNAGTPVKIKGINVPDYNISTKVVSVISERKFTYSLPSVRANLPAGAPAGLAPGNGAAAIIETDTVSGASPYIFNCSLRSVYGLQGMHADGSKADGFRSMVVAQFTAVSLQKDDRAFVKYDPSNRRWSGIGYGTVNGEALSQESSSNNDATVFHLDSDAVYRDGWTTTHIKMSNDAVIQIVSVFAIGFHKHFECLSGGDASITNSNSNFGQFSLAADGFKRAAFDKDDRGYITGVVTPRSLGNSEVEIEWAQFDLQLHTPSTYPERVYLLGYTVESEPPPIIAQGFRIGAKVNDTVFLKDSSGAKFEATTLMTDTIPVNGGSNTVTGSNTSAKVFTGITLGTLNGQTVYSCTAAHNLSNGESIRIFSETGDLPEGLESNKVYYAVTKSTTNIPLSNAQFRIASSVTNANLAEPITIRSYGGVELRVESRVSDKKAGEIGHPIQYDYTTKRTGTEGNWFVYVSSSNNTLTSKLTQLKQDGATSNPIVEETEISYFRRIEDGRSIDEKIYKLRYVVPKELNNSRDPVTGFVLQESASVNVRDASDFSITSITTQDYDFDRNPRFISSCTYTPSTDTIEITADRSHSLKVGDFVNLNNIPSSNNTGSRDKFGFNGSFEVDTVVDGKTFTVKDTDVFGIARDPGDPIIDVQTRDKNLPNFSRNDTRKNHYIYRVETINPFIKDVQDGVYYLYILNADNKVSQASGEFSSFKYSQNITDLYPQLDRDNEDDNPPAAVSYAKRTPLGEVVTNDLKRSLTRETIDSFFGAYSLGNRIVGVTDNGNNTRTLTLLEEHGLNGIHFDADSTSFANNGSGHTPGTYHNVKLFNDASSPSIAIWDGATATVTIDSNGAASQFTVTEHGSGYTANETLYFDTTTIGGTPSATSASITLASTNISDGSDSYVQITGIGTATGGYYRIDGSSGSLQNKNQIVIKTHGSPEINPGEYVTVVGKVKQLTSINGSAGSVFTALSAEENNLSNGNSIELLDTNDQSLGNFVVSSIEKSSGNWSYGIFSDVNIGSAVYYLKHALSANDASADNFGENIGTRLHTFFDSESLKVGGTTDIDITQTKIPYTTTLSHIGSRFPLGCYIQIDNEIMRVRSSTIINNELEVIRGSMGTIAERHQTNSEIRKIKLLPIELRRPSILRASGHTFEYLGYGPGNYSTGLPQVQVKTLSEDEEFLSQSQETAGGTVLYTGMDSDGDFYIGNTKYSAQSGEQKTFDVPIPTITGQDPNTLSVVFDEVIVKDRILVEGGKSKQLLSQFDGPVTFSSTVRFSKPMTLTSVPKSLRTNGSVDIGSETDATNCTDQNAALRVSGGAAIGKSLHVCGRGVFNSTNNINSISNGGGSPSGYFGGGVYIGNDLHVHNDAWVEDQLHVNDRALVENHIRIGGSAASTQLIGGQSDKGIQPFVDAAANNGYGVGIGCKTHAFAEAHIGRIMIGYYDSAKPNTTGNQTITTRSGELKLSAEQGDPGSHIEANSRFEVNVTENATSASTGALRVDGGAGIKKDLYVGDDLFVNDDGSFGGQLEVTGKADLNGDLEVGNSFKVSSFGTLTGSKGYSGTGNIQTTNGDVIVGGRLNAPNQGSEHKIGNLRINNGAITGVTSIDLALDAERVDVKRTSETTASKLPILLGNFMTNNAEGPQEVFRDKAFYYNNFTEDIHCPNDIIAFNSSDERLKDNISKIEDPLAKVVSLGGYTFDWNENTKKEGTETGVIAQEVEALGLPGIVTTRDDGYKAVRYEKLVPLLIEAIKELNDKVSSLEDKLNN